MKKREQRKSSSVSSQFITKIKELKIHQLIRATHTSENTQDHMKLKREINTRQKH